MNNTDELLKDLRAPYTQKQSRRVVQEDQAADVIEALQAKVDEQAERISEQEHMLKHYNEQEDKVDELQAKVDRLGNPTRFIEWNDSRTDNDNHRAEHLARIDYANSRGQ
jgi:hypothetical protein